MTERRSHRWAKMNDLAGSLVDGDRCSCLQTSSGQTMLTYLNGYKPEVDTERSGSLLTHKQSTRSSLNVFKRSFLFQSHKPLPLGYTVRYSTPAWPADDML